MQLDISGNVISKKLTQRILIFNLIMSSLFIISSLFMVYFLYVLRHNDWSNLILFIGYYPSLGPSALILMPNFPFFVFIITVVGDFYYWVKVRKQQEMK